MFIAKKTVTKPPFSVVNMTMDNETHQVCGSGHWQSPLGELGVVPAHPSGSPITNSSNIFPHAVEVALPASPIDTEFFAMMNPWSQEGFHSHEPPGVPLLAEHSIQTVDREGGASTNNNPEQEINNVFANVNVGALPYSRIVSKGRVIYRHSTAGQTYGKGKTPWEAQRRKNIKERGGNPWGIWQTQDEWESAKWMATTRVSQSSLNTLLRTIRYRRAGYSFKTAKMLFAKIENEMDGFGGPDWYAEDITLAGAEKDKETLFYRDIQACADFLLGRPYFADKMAFAPEQMFASDDVTRLYENPWTADWWNRQQDSLPIGTTLGGLIFASDATQLSTHSGDVAAHAVYMTLANLDKTTRASTSARSWILVAYIPKSKFLRTVSKMEDRPAAVRQRIANMLNRCLFHRCMEVITRPLLRTTPHPVVDPEGNVRSVLYALFAYVADLEEQHVIGGISQVSCPHCDCDGTNIGKAECSPPRTQTEVLKRIKTIKDIYQTSYKRPIPLEVFLNESSKQHLNGVDRPFWENLPNIDIFKALSPDLLHGFHKFFFDHVHKWDLAGVGRDEYNARVKSQVHFTGDRAFPKGILHISQMTGVEHRTLAHTHLAIVADSPNNITPASIAATRAAMDLIYLSQLPIHTKQSLATYRQAYQDLMEYRWAWVENGTRRGKKVVLDHFNIPKMHVLRHLDEHIQLKGSADNFSTETMEKLHGEVKEAYRASNRREWKKQTVRWLTRREKMQDFEEWMQWCNGEAGYEIEPDNDIDWADDESESEIASEADSDNEVKFETETEADLGEFSGDEDLEFELAGEDTDNWDDDNRSEHEGEDDSEEGYTMIPDQQEQLGYITTYLENVAQATQQATVGGGQGEGGGRGQKRKHPEPNGEPIGLGGDPTRSLPQPRLQDSHILSGLQKINQQASLRRQTFLDISRVFHLGLQPFLRAIKRNSFLSSLPITVNEYTYVDTWDALRTFLHPQKPHAKTKMERMRAKPARGESAAQCDPVFYVPSGVNDPSFIQLQDCSVGQLRVLFRLMPTTLVPTPPLMACVEIFTKIPRTHTTAPVLHKISKRLGQYEIIFASQIMRLCSLAPVFSGPAARDVDRSNVLERYTTFYVNKYRNVLDYAFVEGYPT
ncbi:hypothetical protein RhiJN_20614 [Ceratobasidium sp. AG-Ba]|nr:hypothetical protein RhiJN_20614 [Ceratobasidium sp. AG-Ba]